MRATWNHRNSTIFNHAKRNPATFLETTKVMFHEMFTYANYINCPDTSFSGKQRYSNRWTPSPQDWVKFNTNTIRKRKTNNTTISYICRNVINMTMTKYTTSAGDLDILNAGMLTIRETASHAKLKNYPKLIKSKPHITTQALNEHAISCFL